VLRLFVCSGRGWGHTNTLDKLNHRPILALTT
jgi:hypothetical protein